MGTILHYSIVVTCWDKKRVEAAHAFAVNTGASVTNVIGPVTNGFHSFLVGPDGSKYGWDEQKAGQLRRDEIVAHLVENGVEYVEVQHGETYAGAAVMRSNCHNDSDT